MLSGSGVSLRTTLPSASIDDLLEVDLGVRRVARRAGRLRRRSRAPSAAGVTPAGIASNDGRWSFSSSVSSRKSAAAKCSFAGRSSVTASPPTNAFVIAKRRSPCGTPPAKRSSSIPSGSTCWRTPSSPSGWTSTSAEPGPVAEADELPALRRQRRAPVAPRSSSAAIERGQRVDARQRDAAAGRRRTSCRTARRSRRARGRSTTRPATRFGSGPVKRPGHRHAEERHALVLDLHLDVEVDDEADVGLPERVEADLAPRTRRCPSLTKKSIVAPTWRVFDVIAR